MSKLRGHDIHFDQETQQWRYTDNDEPTASIGNQRNCGHCGLQSRLDDHDACLGKLPGVLNACCGHGSESDAYVQLLDRSCIRGAKAMQFFDSMANRVFEEVE